MLHSLGPAVVGGSGNGRLFVTEQLYDALADWWPVISPPSGYAEEAALYVDMIRGAARCPIREVLELGSGGGNNASHMKRAFTLTLVEPADRMRELSRALNPECEHVSGDMRDVRLGRVFDAVFIHDATRETFSEGTEHGGGEDERGRRARYLQWTLPPASGGTSFEAHYAFLLRESDGTVSAAHDVHREGLFPRSTWLRLFGEVGLAASLWPRIIEGVEYDSFVALRDAP
jgi:hypothetical protein